MVASSWPDLFFGTRFRVRSRRGNVYALTFLHRDDGSRQAYVRMDNRCIARLQDTRVEWSSWSEASDPPEPVLGQGDEVLVESNRAVLRGPLLDLDRDRIRIRLLDLSEIAVPRREVAAFYLLYRAPDLQPGDRFLAQTRRGKELRGRLLSLDRGVATVELSDGGRARMTLANLDPDSLVVLIPIPIQDLFNTSVDLIRAETRRGEILPDLTADEEEQDLVLVLPDGTRRLINPGERLVIGRSSKADVTVALEGISRRHLELIAGLDGGLRARDLGSLNGSTVDGAPIDTDEPIEVYPGQTIRMDKVPLKIELA